MRGDPWYREGLRFECIRCGGCCTGFPGTVRVTNEEIEEIWKLVPDGTEVQIKP